MTRELVFSRTLKETTIEAKAVFSGDDLTVSISGGDKPHIGSISIATPRESLTGDGSRSATVSTINLLSHKDDVVGDMFAYRLAVHLGHTCVVTCGIHIDDIAPSDIEKVVAVCRDLLDDMVEAL